MIGVLTVHMSLLQYIQENAGQTLATQLIPHKHGQASTSIALPSLFTSLCLHLQKDPGQKIRTAHVTWQRSKAGVAYYGKHLFLTLQSGPSSIAGPVFHLRNPNLHRPSLTARDTPASRAESAGTIRIMTYFFRCRTLRCSLSSKPPFRITPGNCKRDSLANL